MLTRLLAAADSNLKGAMSFEEIRRSLCDAFTQAFPNTPGHIVDIYQDHCIISDGTGTLYEVPYTIDDNGGVVTGDMAKVRRQVDYVKIQASFRLLAAEEDTGDDSKGYRWHVQVIEAGPDKQTGLEYPYDVLRAAVPLYNGARVFALQQGQHASPDNPYGKSVRDLVGWISDVKENTTGLEGHLNILKSAKWLRDMILDSFERGKEDLVGLSHDVLGKVTAANGKRTVEKIVKVDSVDIVYEPIAGGKITRMAAAARAGQKEGNMLEKLLAALKANRPEAYKTIEAKVKDGTVTEDEVIALLAAGQVLDVSGLDERISSAVATAVAAAVPSSSATDEVKILACRLTLKDELKGSGLPEISQERISAQFDGKVFETEALRAAITSEKEYLDKITGSGVVTGSGQVRVVSEEPEKVQAAFDKLLGVDVDERFSTVAPFRSLRAAYTRVTGDADVSGRISREGDRFGQAYMEFLRLPAAYASSSFTYLLGNTMYRRMVQDFRAVDFGEQILISYVRNAADFKTLESVRIGYYGDLPDVDPEALDYAELTNFTDEEVSYAINQKGGIVTVSRKTIINDDLRALQRIPQRLGRAAKRTKAQRCWNKIIDNATYKGDSKALFHEDHANLGATGLTNDATGVTTLATRLTAMFNQTEPDSEKKLGLEAQYLWVPREKLEIAKGLNSPWPGVAGGNPHAGRFGVNHERIITNKLTTDTNDWGLVAAREDTELLEIAYLNGQEEPEFFVADNPLAGQMFLADKLQYKVRHEYEVEIVDFRGFDKSVVA